MDAAVDRPNALRTGTSSTDETGRDPIVLGDTITPAQTPAPNTTGLTPRLGAAVIAPGLQLPELTLTQPPEQRPRGGSETDGMKRVRSKNVLGDAPKAPRVDLQEDAPTARRRAESLHEQPSLNFFEEPTRSGYTPEKETRERSSTQELTDDQQDESDSDSSDDEAAIAWLQRQKRPSATPSKRSSAGSRRRSSASQALSPPPPPPPPQPESPTLPGFSRKTRESESARKERAAQRPAPSPKPPPPPRSESSDDGGLDDLQAIHTAPRSREKHSRSHSRGVARAMAIAKRNGQRSASRGGG